MHRIQASRARGFTLVELLVVVAVLLVLVAMLLPTLSRASEAARRAKCGSNLRQIAMGLRLYAIANNGWYPLYGYTGEGAYLWNDAAGGDEWWLTGNSATHLPDNYKVGFGYQLARANDSRNPQYISNFRVFYCPGSDRGLNSDTNQDWWSNRGGTKVASSYLQFNVGGFPQYGTTGTDNRAYVAQKMGDPPSRVLSVDKARWTGTAWDTEGRSRGGVKASNHPNGVNFLFNDGRVDFMPFPSPTSKKGIKTVSGPNYTGQRVMCPEP